jgi:hypothetical protein
MHVWFLIETFYLGLKRASYEQLDAAAGGAFSRYNYLQPRN